MRSEFPNGFLLIVATIVVVVSAGNFYQDFEITFGDGRAQILENGQLLTLTMDKSSGSGCRSFNEYLFGKFEMQVKLVPGNSAGTVTTFYLSSVGDAHDEIDLEFLGNLSGDPYILHTNIFAQGIGNREQEFYLWFDPTQDFHTYSVLWNNQSIIFYVDGTPIREFENMESNGVPFPKYSAMRIYLTLWDAEEWATRGGLVKTDWAQAPFTASYRNFNAQQAHVWDSSSNNSHLKQSLDATRQAKRIQLKRVQKNHMIYNYCDDTKRFPRGLPPECLFA